MHVLFFFPQLYLYYLLILQDKIVDHMSHSASNSVEISKEDAIGKILGPEHPGRVRGLGLGACPTSVFGPSYARYGAFGLSSSSGIFPILISPHHFSLTPILFPTLFYFPFQFPPLSLSI